MRPATPSILSAVERTSVGEDRLTEALACVAHVNQRFAADLIRLAGGDPQHGERYVAGTQRLTPTHRRVDLEVATYRGLARTGLLWVEVKAGAAYQPDQLPDYAGHVVAPGVGELAGRLLTIIPPGTKPVVDSEPVPRWVTRTWSEVALVADRLGREWGRRSGHRRWRDAAMQPSAPSQWRYVAELIIRLEELEYARVEPLTAEDVVAAQRVVSLPKTLEDLVAAASRRLDGVERREFRPKKGGCYRTFAPLAPRWFNDKERYGNAYPELQYWFEEDWTPDQRGLPAFFAGLTFNELAESTRYALLDEAWQAQLPDEVAVGGKGRLLRVGRTKYLSELIVAGASFDEQLEVLVMWANSAFADVMGLHVLPSRWTASATGTP